jgi:S1-C subfamily serine protease
MLFWVVTLLSISCFPNEVSVGEKSLISVDSIGKIGQDNPEPNMDIGDASIIVRAQEQVLNKIYRDLLFSVVQIQVKQKIDSTYSRSNTPQNGQDLYRSGAGSGFIWQNDGYIVTNHHVVADADLVRIVFHDGLSVPATVIGIDPDSDLAVLYADFDVTKYNAVTLGNSDTVIVGELVAAIGNPFGQNFTLTSGIVSAVGRSIRGASNYSIPEAIQTDAAINPGNSGGPLLNRKGEVIGINSQIITTSESNAGIAFAVPVNIAKKVIPALIIDGFYEYAWLGISGLTLTSEISEYNNLALDIRGALITEVVPASPADIGGIKGSDSSIDVDGIPLPVGGDIVVNINGSSILSIDDLVSYLVNYGIPDKIITFTVLRNGEYIDIEVKLGTRPQN